MPKLWQRIQEPSLGRFPRVTWRGNTGLKSILEFEISLLDSKVDYLTLGDLGLERSQHVPLAPYRFSQLSYGERVGSQ